MTGLLVFLMLCGAALLLAWSRPPQPGGRGHMVGHHGVAPGAKLPPRRGILTVPRRRARREPDRVDPALMIDLLGAMLSAGAPLGGALAVLGDTCPPPLSLSVHRVQGALALGADWETAWTSAISQSDATTGATLRELAAALRFAALTGASSAGIVYACAGQLRRRRNSDAQRRAATLGVRLVVPLGLCYLPAFICLGVLPVVFALVPRWG